MKKWLVISGAAAVVILVGGAYAANVFPKELPPVSNVNASSLSDELIEQGENLTMLGDCAACHTPEGSRALEGGIGLPTPFGTIYSTNITPDPETGIGTWSYEAFERAMRVGIDREGNHLYPAFPYDHFAAITGDDMKALYQYLMSQEPVRTEPVANELRFPYSIRPLLAGWKLLFHHPEPFEPNPAFDDEQNRGFYLAETLGHCAACHSPRNVFGAVKRDEYLAGGEAEGWLIPPLGEASIAPVSWNLDDYADYLFDGWSEHHGLAGGPMGQVVDNMYDADEDDIFAIAAWLAAITPQQDEDARDARLEEIASLDLPADFDPAFTGQDLPADIAAGAKVFKAKCVECHKERISDSQPVSLGLTYAANAPSPTNVFNAVLKGLEPTFGASSRRMQPVGLSAEDLAAVTAFVRWRFTDKPRWDGLPDAAETAVDLKDAH
jgi:mono/diheme cytochrome c family protein